MALQHRLFAAASLAMLLGACASKEALPPKVAAAPPAQGEAPAALAAPGHLVRADVDRVLTTQGPPWVLRRIINEEVIGSNGKFVGWRLVGLPEEWHGIDLKPGDIVTRVNGLALETPDNAWEAWMSVARSPELTFSVVRDGTARQIVVPIDGPPVPETAKALGRDPGPSRAAPPPRGASIPLGGTTADAADDDAY